MESSSQREIASDLFLKNSLARKDRNVPKQANKETKIVKVNEALVMREKARDRIMLLNACKNKTAYSPRRH